MTTWAKNEPTAIARQCALQIFKDDGTPAPRGTDFIALGAVWVRGVNSPSSDVALGTMTNERRPLTLASFTFTADSVTDQLTKAAHGLQTGDGPVLVSNAGGALPAGLAAATNYYVILVDANTFKLATTLANAYAGVAIDITTNGTGVQTLANGGATLTRRGMDGRFVYQATQAETNHDAAEMAIVVDDGGTGNYALKNSAGGSAYVTMDRSGSAWSAILEAGHTRDDALRAVFRDAVAPISVAGTAYTVRDAANTKNSHHGTITAAGRSGTVIDDLT